MTPAFFMNRVWQWCLWAGRCSNVQRWLTISGHTTMLSPISTILLTRHCLRRLTALLRSILLSLKKIREEGTDEYLVAFFFRVAISRMNDELLQKERNSRHTFLF